MDQEKIKENVLRVLGRKGPMTISNLKLFAAGEETKENFHAVIDALAGEGKVLKEELARAGSFHVSLPGGKAPAPSNAATVPSKKPRSVNRKAASTPREPVVRSRKSAAPINGSGAIAAAIADLESRRSLALDQAAKLYHALETLRALACEMACL